MDRSATVTASEKTYVVTVTSKVTVHATDQDTVHWRGNLFHLFPQSTQYEITETEHREIADYRVLTEEQERKVRDRCLGAFLRSCKKRKQRCPSPDSLWGRFDTKERIYVLGNLEGIVARFRVEEQGERFSVRRCDT
jgi:hypothetical protein